MQLFQVVVIAIVEGLTEFLPISSTGHMIIASSLLGIASDPFTKLFEVCIQLGAILSVVVLYYKKFFPLTNWKFYVKLLVAVTPALALLFVDNLFKAPTVESEEKITFKKGLMIGFWQCLALIPGMSRSAATIIGGMQQKLTRNVAAEFSFFLAVPTMAAATGYKLLKAYKTTPDILLNKENLILLGVGNLVAFIVALLAIKFFIGFLQKHGFKLFGWYRIIAGVTLLTLIYTGILK